jgi:Ni/Co efflux regulator RcnB
MSKATRILAMAGMALVAGATIGAGPAAASASTAQGTTSATQSTQQANKNDRSREWVQGYYRTRGQCERVGYIGERFNRWDDHDCERVRRGFRVFYRLEVERDWHGGGNWDNGHGNGGDWDGHGHGGDWGNGHDGPRR